MILKAWGCLLFIPPPIISHVAFSVLLFVTQTQVYTKIQFFLLPLLHRERLLLHASSCLCHFMFPGQLFTLVFQVLWSWPLGGPLPAPQSQHGQGAPVWTQTRQTAMLGDRFKSCTFYVLGYKIMELVFHV